MVQLLLVEDEPQVADLTREALADAGFCVTLARDDRAAYRVLDGEARSFAAVVTDINLGAGVTGFDVARHARGLNRGIKVVYISGQGPHPARFGVAGALMLAKPFTPRDLAERIVAFVAA